jgi:hypothetical protein
LEVLLAGHYSPKLRLCKIWLISLTGIIEFCLLSKSIY